MPFDDNFSQKMVMLSIFTHFYLNIMHSTHSNRVSKLCINSASVVD